MNLVRSFIVSAALASSTLGLVAMSTSAQAGISTCGAWRCGYNGIELNGLNWNGIGLNDIKWNGISLNGYSLNGPTLNGISMQGTALNGAQAGEAVAVTLPSGETLSLR